MIDKKHIGMKLPVYKATAEAGQLRGRAEQRQVEGARLALQHNLGLGGACVVTLYQAV